MLRKTAVDKVAKYARSCLGGKAFFAIEEEHSFIWNFRHTRILDKYAVVPIGSIVHIKLHTRFGVNLVAVCEDDAQILEVAGLNHILKNYQAVFVSNSWSSRLPEYEDG